MISVKKLLKFIFLVLLVAFVTDRHKLDSSEVEIPVDVLTAQINSYHISAASSPCDVCLPPQSFCVNLLRVSQSARRTYQSQRTNSHFTTIGRFAEPSVHKFISNNSFYSTCVFVKSVRSLISLGKLVI